MKILIIFLKIAFVAIILSFSFQEFFPKIECEKFKSMKTIYEIPRKSQAYFKNKIAGYRVIILNDYENNYKAPFIFYVKSDTIPIEVKNQISSNVKVIFDEFLDVDSLRLPSTVFGIVNCKK